MRKAQKRGEINKKNRKVKGRNKGETVLILCLTSILQPDLGGLPGVLTRLHTLRHVGMFEEKSDSVRTFENL